MNRISHKQALKWIDRRLDGLLTGKQVSLLNEHLDSCSACRAYADEMSLLPAQLQKDFHAHWDEKPGPSQDIMQNVTAKARRIPMANRVSSGFKLLTGTVALVALALLINFIISQSGNITTLGTQTANNLPRPQDRLLAFSSNQNGNYDIYTMRADGSDLTDLTNNPARDGSPYWSPDGKRIAFTSDRDGSGQIYVMDADGSNVVQLTKAEGYAYFDLNGNSPWSPDGTKLIFLQRPDQGQKATLYRMDSDGKNKTALKKEPGEYVLPTWSADGEHIAFLSYEPGARRGAPSLFVVDADGKNLTDLTASLQAEQNSIFVGFNYYWSADGSSIFFHGESTVSAQPGSTVYKAGLDGTLTIVATLSESFVLDWQDGTALQQAEGGRTLTWTRAGGTAATLDVCEGTDQILNMSYKRSDQGNSVFGADCSGSGWALYWANADGTMTSRILNPGMLPGHGGLFITTWSPDDHYLAFVRIEDSGNSPMSLYVLDLEKARQDPSTQPLHMADSAGPSWQPVSVPKVASLPDLKVDPQSCKAASELDAAVRPPNELYGYKLIQGTSVVDGDFSYDFWLYCDPALKPNNQENTSTVAGLGIFTSWHYNGPQVEGSVEYRYEFEPNIVLGGGSWEGPLYETSLTGARFGIDIPKADLQEYIRQGTPIQFRTIVDTLLGHKEALLSFKLEPTGQGLKVVDLQAEAEPPTAANEQLISFVSTRNGNSEIYRMHADGSAVLNLTNNPAEDIFPAWSPDGKRIAFLSDRDGDYEIYVINADGSGLTRLTDDGGFNARPVWSPDGTKIAYAVQSIRVNVPHIYIVDVNDRTRRRLSDGIIDAPQVGPVAWSPDGQYVFFESNLQISKVDINSGEITPITSIDETAAQSVLSGDGSKLFYLESCSQSSTELCYKVKSISTDGTGKETLATMELHDICRSTEAATTGTAPANGAGRYEIMKWSPDRTKILFALYCQGKDGRFYIANADGSDFRALTSYPVLYNVPAFDWSPDSQSIIFSTTFGNGQGDRAYLLNIREALQNPDTAPTPLDTSASQFSFFAWQPAANASTTVPEKPTPAVTSQPASQADQRFIAFGSAMAGDNPDIYIMHPDGSGLTNLTNDPARDLNPFWSPDGKRLAFESDRSRLAQIYVMEADGSKLFQVTEGQTEHRLQTMNPWSPDGSRLLFTEKATAEDTWMLYAIGVDGQGKTLLGQVPDLYSSASWSPDGKHVAFIVPERLGDRTMSRIHVVDAQGGAPTDASKLVPPDEDLMSRNFSWSADGQSLLFIGARTAWDSSAGTSSRYAAYEASLDGERLTEKAVSSTPMNSWWDGTAFIPGFYPSTLTWLRSDGTYRTFEPLANCGSAANSSVGFYAKQSPNGQLLFNVNCPNDELWFYWANADGTTVQPLLDFPIAAPGGGINNIVWSTDDKYAVVTLQASGLTYLYIIDVDGSLANPALRPVQLAIYGDVLSSNVAWQPVP